MANPSIIEEISTAIDNIDFGSVEVIVQNGEVTQISTRIIKKTNIKSVEKPKGNIANTKVTKPGININFKY